MTTIDTGATLRHSATAATPRLLRVLARISETWAARAERRETFRVLDNLGDRELDDIGLTRADVDAMR